MIVSLVLAAIVGAGWALFNKGRKSGTWFMTISGTVFVLFGVILFALNIMAELKKAGMI